MIPLPVPALTGLTVLVTRPAAQAPSLCQRIEALGGTAVSLPAVVIEPLAEPVLLGGNPPAAGAPDLVIFVSRNAVTYGLGAVALDPDTRVAAIGKATAAALTAAGSPPHVVPESGFTSEALLAHPALQSESIRRVLIVRGGQGREVMADAFTARGITVDYLEVYRRVPPSVEPERIAALEEQWRQGGIDVVTATSGEILRNLHQMLTDGGRMLLATSPLLVVSPRVAALARELGVTADILVAPAADDDTLVGVLATWRTRARVPE